MKNIFKCLITLILVWIGSSMSLAGNQENNIFVAILGFVIAIIGVIFLVNEND